ncbi:MAG: RNA polymerase sigma-70 factor [Cytophagales bacterium]|nr:RNA polymerase sigma-70 factor [Cytophagales bacterium]
MNSKSGQNFSDQKLIEQVSKGNELAFDHFYNKYWDSLFISAYVILKDVEACKDIVQDVFLNVWERSNLNKIDNIEAYLHQSVKFKVLMALRKGKVSDRHLQTLQELIANTTEEQLDYEDLNETIESSIKSLPAKCQEVFRLSRIEHLSNNQIAERLSISVRTVETHISNALRQIRSNLDSSAASLILFILLK